MVSIRPYLRVEPLKGTTTIARSDLTHKYKTILEMLDRDKRCIFLNLWVGDEEKSSGVSL
jgi:hypothetical protein